MLWVGAHTTNSTNKMEPSVNRQGILLSHRTFFMQKVGAIAVTHFHIWNIRPDKKCFKNAFKMS
jgi:hypothetical protein